MGMEMSRLTPDGTAELVLRDQILRPERVKGTINFPCSEDHEQNWQPYTVDLYSCHIYMMTIHTYTYNKPLMGLSKVNQLSLVQLLRFF